MKKLGIIGALTFGIFLNPIIGQTFKQKFDDLVSRNDTVEQIKLLEEWENKNNNDPELYVSYFNFFVRKSMKEVVRIENNPEGDKVLTIMDKDTSKKDPVGYMYSEIHYEPAFLKKGYYYIDKGIEKSPARLDMRFGKIYILGETHDYVTFTNEIISTIAYSSVIKNKWTWSENKPVDDPKNFMLGAIQDYQLQLYNTGDDALLDNMRKIAEAILKLYPDHIESLSNLSVVYLIKEDYNKALEHLLKAEKLAPQDYIILNNIAQAYKLKGDNNNAIKYYELTIKYGDAQAKEQAEKQISDLRKK